MAESTSEWWKTFFSGAAVESWLMMPTKQMTESEADFIQKSLDVTPPAQLLDVPCGGGRHCHALAARAYKMTGVDLSTEFLTAARSLPADSPGHITWEQREMRDLPWSNRFDGAYCFGNSFGYLDDQGNAQFLKAIFATLKPGAKFVLDTGYILETILPALQERAWYPIGEYLMLAQRRYEPVESRLHVEYTWIRDGKTEKGSMSARLHSVRELLQLFKETGFAEVQLFSSLEREAFRFGSHRLFLVATKP
jgi:SAM-dependent methyltransferase